MTAYSSMANCVKLEFLHLLFPKTWILAEAEEFGRQHGTGGAQELWGPED